VKSVNDLRLRLAELRKSGPSRDLVEGILVRLRPLLERRGSGEEFPTLQLMCHWAFHDRLRDASIIYATLTRLTLALRQLFDNPSPNSNAQSAAFTKAGATALNLDGLRSEMRLFLSRERLGTFVTDEQAHWYEFVCGLLEIISERIIGLPEPGKPLSKPARRYVEAVQRAPTSGFPGSIATIEVLVKDGKFKLHLKTTSNVHWAFTIASLEPFSEYDAADLPTTEWAANLVHASI
jgi:hypothetical protein